jgi:hypothetical protein
MAALLHANGRLKELMRDWNHQGPERETSETDFELTSRQMICSGQPQPLSGWVGLSKSILNNSYCFP